MSAGLDSRLGSMGGVMRSVVAEGRLAVWPVSRYRPVSRSGFRPSEMRGLRWIDIDFEGRQINVNQRADASRRIGKLKSKAAYRSIPSPPIVLNVLRAGSKPRAVSMCQSVLVSAQSAELLKAVRSSRFPSA